jgi:hypothetical protein
MSEIRDLVRMQTRAFNGRDLDNLCRQAQPDAPCFCDGEWVGEGPAAMRAALERELTQDANLVGRIGTLDNEPILVELGGGEGHYEARGAVRFKGDAGGRIRELRIDHNARIVAAIVPDPDA